MTVLSIAHRGEPIRHRENTVEAVAAAIEAGADMVEIDVRLTADGAPVLLHDADLSRLWGLDCELAALDLVDMQTVRGPAGQRIPGLEEVARLAAEQHCQLMVDLPAADAGPVAYDLLDRLGVLDSMLFAGQTGPLRAHASLARIALSWESIELPSNELLHQRRPEFFNPYFRLLTGGIVEEMHERGLRVSVWTVDHPADMAAAIAQGADAIISNSIVELKAAIEREVARDRVVGRF